MTTIDLRLHATKASLWSAAEIASRQAIQFIVLVLLAHLLTPADFGMMAMLLVLISVGTILADAGFGTALIQRQDATSDDEATAFYSTLGIGLAAAGAMWMSADVIAGFYRQPALVPLIHVIVLVLPISALGSVPDALLTKRLNFQARTHAQALASLFSGILSVCLAVLGFGVWTLVWQALANAAIRTLLLWKLSRWRPHGAFRRSSLHTLGGFGLYMFLANLFNTASVRLQSVLIGRMFDTSALGLYTVAQNTQDAPTSFLGALLGRVALPSFSTLAHDRERLRNALRASIRASLFLFFPCMLGIAVMARPLIELAYGPRWTDAAPILTFLALSAALWPIHVLNLSALTAQGRSDLLFGLEVVKDLILVSLSIVASPAGPVAMAAALLAASLAAVLINTWYSSRMLDYGIVAQLRDQKETFLICALAALPSLGMLHWLARGPIADTLAIMSAIAVYTILALAMRIPGFVELRNMAISLYPKQTT